MTDNDFRFRFAERCLYDYKTNVARLEVLRADLRTLDALSSAKGQAYDALPCLGYLRDAVSARLERRTEPSRRLYDDLRAGYVLEGSPKTILRGILELFYLGENTWQATASELGLSRMSFFRRRNELVALSLRYLGF